MQGDRRNYCYFWTNCCNESVGGLGIAFVVRSLQKRAFYIEFFH